jgi:PIN domain nuclease of toxin-antitoxin system
MASVIYLDTHVVAWLFAKQMDLLPGAVRARIEESDLLISPAVKLELQYLFEIRRITVPGAEVVETLGKELALRICDLPFPNVIDIALDASWTRDPFDRLIASQATLRGATLITRDRNLRAHCPWAEWPGSSDSTREGDGE